MDAFDKLRGRFGQYFEQKKILGEIAECEQQAAASPTDITPLQRLADLYQAVSRTEDAINSLTTAAEISRAEGRLEPALAFYRKAERIASAERRIQILRRMIPLQVEQKAYSQSFKLAREIIEYYLANDQEEVAIGFFKTLPKLGERDESYRRELGEIFLLRDNNWSQGARGTWHGKTQMLKMAPKEDFSELAVLLVDDEQGQLKQMTAALQPLGCEILYASNGVEALARIASRRPVLVISDLVMPKMDGSQLFEHLQNDPATEAIPFVCLTSRDDEGEQAAALERGVEDYWIKPFRPKELCARVKRILRRVKHHSALAGSLSQLAIPDLLQMLESNSRTGSLLLESQGRSATVYIVEGRPIDATMTGREGEHAIYALMDWHEGTFQFTPRLLDRPQRIFDSTQGLLMEAMRRYDEEAEAIASLPTNKQAVLALDSDPTDEDFPGKTGRAELERIRPLLDGQHPLDEIITTLKGYLEPLQLLAALYGLGKVKNLTPDPGFSTEITAGEPGDFAGPILGAGAAEPEALPLNMLDDDVEAAIVVPPPPEEKALIVSDTRGTTGNNMWASEDDQTADIQIVSGDPPTTS